MDRVSHLSCEYINPIGVEVRIEVIIIREGTKSGLGPIMHTEAIQDITLIIEVVMEIICKVIKGMEEAIIIGEATIEIKIMIGIGVGHTKGRLETEVIVAV